MVAYYATDLLVLGGAMLRALLTVLILLSTTVLQVCASSTLLTPLWRTSSNPSPGMDALLGLCSDGLGRLYAVGFEYSNGRRLLRLEVRDVGSGGLALSKVYSLSEGDTIGRGCAVSSSTLYVVGNTEVGGVRRWLIVAISLESFEVVRNVSSVEGRAMAVAVAGDSLLVAGDRVVKGGPSGDTSWRVELRRLPDLELVSYYESNPSTAADAARYVAVNPVDGSVWVAGDNRGRGWWRIEVLDRELRRVAEVEPLMPGSAHSLCFSSTGEVYVAGNGGLVKLDRSGAELGRHTVREFLTAVTCYGGYVIASGLIAVAKGGEPVLDFGVYVVDEELRVVQVAALNASLRPVELYPPRLAVVGDTLAVSFPEYFGTPDKLDAVWSLAAFRLQLPGVEAPRTTVSPTSPPTSPPATPPPAAPATPSWYLTAVAVVLVAAVAGSLLLARARRR